MRKYLHSISNKRKRLQNMETMSWLKARHTKNVKKSYILLPEEIKEEENINRIFDVFDRDGSQSLDMGELLTMFHQYNIPIKKSDLEELFTVVDEDKDGALNQKEFKNCVFSREANEIFRQIMRRVRQTNKMKPPNEQNPYLPTSFGNMVSYLSYLMQRRDTLHTVKHEQNLGILKQYKIFFSLFDSLSLDQNDNRNKVLNQAKLKISMNKSKSSKSLKTKEKFKITPFYEKNVNRSISNDDIDNMKDFQTEIDDIMKTAQEKGKNEAFTLCESLETGKLFDSDLLKSNISQIENKSRYISIKPTNTIESERNKEQEPRFELPKSLKNINKIMQENIKITLESQENKKFKKILGLNDNTGDKNRPIKFHPVIEELIGRPKTYLPKINPIKSSKNTHKKIQSHKVLPKINTVG